MPNGLSPRLIAALLAAARLNREDDEQDADDRRSLLDEITDDRDDRER